MGDPLCVSQCPVEPTISRHASTVLGYNKQYFQYLTVVFVYSYWVGFKEIK